MGEEQVNVSFELMLLNMMKAHRDIPDHIYSIVAAKLLKENAEKDNHHDAA